MRIPSIEHALLYLKEAEMRNPGPWIAHSFNVAEAAKRVSARIPNLNSESAYCFGLLHDIGRREGVTGMRHVIDGYKFLTSEGYDDTARICMTHSFPLKNVMAFSSTWDGTEQEIDEIRSYLDGIKYNDYDRLVQLCDALAQASGFCLLEKRLVDVLMRYQNFNAFTLHKWQAYFDLKAYFEKIIGCSIYDLLPGVEANTFS